VVSYLNRLIDSLLDQMLQGLPAVALEGAKAVGKTVTAERRAATTISLDQENQRQALVSAPERLGSLPGPVLIDEWQHWPEVWNRVRRLVDRGALPGQFILTGSLYPANAAIHSGAGRIVTLKMRPLSLTERVLERPTVSIDQLLVGQPSRPAGIEGTSSVSLEDYVREITASGFPAIRQLPPPLQGDQLESYIGNVVGREFPLQGVGSRQPETLRRWLRSFAAATATTASLNTVTAGATPGEPNRPTKVTALSYRDVLESLWLLDSVPPWGYDTGVYSRVGAAPKHFLTEPALAAKLLGLDAEKLMTGTSATGFDNRYGPILGRLFEALVAQSLQVYAQVNRAHLSHFRTADSRREVDFVIEREDQVLAVEVKLSPLVNDTDVRHLNWLGERLGPRLADKLVITTGRDAYRRVDGVAVVPAALIGP